MKISENIGKITWSFADKALFVLYGLISIIQSKYLEPSELGKFLLLNTFHWGIFLLVDSLALQGLIKFGSRKGSVEKVNLLALLNLTIISLLLGCIIYLLRLNIADVFNKPEINDILPYLPIFVLLFIPRTYTLKILLRHFKFARIFWVNAAFFAPMILLTFYYIMFYNSLNFERMTILYLTGSFVSSLTGIIFSFKFLKFNMKGEVTYKEFMKFSGPMALHAWFHSVPRLVDTLVITYFFNLTVVGIYGFAKQIYRFFDEAGSAASGLVYPAVVRQLEEGNRRSLSDLVGKSTSFLLFSFIVIIVVMEFGMTEYIIKTFLPYKYFDSIPIFNIMMISALGLPFIILGWVIVAEGRSLVVMTYSFISATSAFIAFILTGIVGNPVLLPLGMITYNFVFGILCYSYVKKHYGLKSKDMFRAFGDTLGFVRSFLKKRSR